MTTATKPSRLARTDVREGVLVATVSKSGRLGAIHWRCEMTCGHVMLSPAKLNKATVGPYASGQYTLRFVSEIDGRYTDCPKRLVCRVCRYMEGRPA
jgi:hypothetical protein